MFPMGHMTRGPSCVTSYGVTAGRGPPVTGTASWRQSQPWKCVQRAGGSTDAGRHRYRMVGVHVRPQLGVRPATRGMHGTSVIDR